MNKCHSFPFSSLVMATLLFVLADVSAEAPEPSGKTGKMGGRAGEKGLRGHGHHGFGELSEDERRKVREALKKVWGSEALQAARKDLTEASDRYREVLRAAIAEADPEVREILVKVLPEGGMPPAGKPGGPPPFAMDGWRMLSDIMQPGFEERVLDRLHSDCERRVDRKVHGILADAHAAVVEDEALEKLRVAFGSTAEQIPRLEALRTLRQAYFKALEKAAPELVGELPDPKFGVPSQSGGGASAGGGRKGSRSPAVK